MQAGYSLSFTSFVLRRMLWAIFLFLVATVITYLIFWVMPPDPANFHSGSGPGPQYVAEMRRFLHLDEPLWRQYLSFLGGLVHGSLGRSLVTRQSVASILAQDAPVTGSLVFGGAVAWLALAVPVGIFAARRPRSLFDRVSMAGVVIGLSAHPVWVGLLLSYFFGFRLGLMPITGYCNFFTGGGAPCSGAVQWAYHLLLPWFTFMLLFAALYVRLVRASMIESLSEDYVRTARAKGAGELRVLFHHALRNCLLPIVTIFGMDLGLAVGGAIFTENVFNLPGLGHEVIVAYGLDDEPVIIGILIFTTVCVIVFNFIVDVAYSMIDPRVRVG